MRKLAIASLICLLTSVAIAAEKPPESTTIQASPESVKDKLTRYMLGQGWTIASDNQYQTVFSKDLKGSQEFAARLLMGNAYANQPVEHATFTFAPNALGTEVTMREEVIVEMPFGRVNRASLNDKKHRVAQADFLASLKGSIEVANAGAKGVNESKVLIGVVFASDSLVLKNVIHGGPADRAGLKSGDMLLYLNGRLVSTVQDFVSEANRSKPGDVAKVLYVRDGKLNDVDLTFEAPPPLYAQTAGER